MKKLLLFLLLPSLSFAQPTPSKSAAQANRNAKPAAVKNAQAGEGFVITGQITGLLDGTVKLTTTQGEQVIATTTAKNGGFVLQGKIEEPGLYWLTLGKEQPQYIFLENMPIRITGKKADIKNIQIEGSQSHQDFLQFRKIFDPLFANLQALSLQAQQAPEEKKPIITQQYYAAIADLNKNVGEFTTARPASYVSAFLLTVTRQTNDNIAEVEERFRALSPAVKASAMGKELETYLAYAKIGSVGTDALEFTQNDQKGSPVSLSQFKGKYVLVDFWASWCKPCRMENPNVVKTFHRFKDKNFTVLGVSLDQAKEPWLKAIDLDKLDWTHVSDLQYWNNAVAQLYHVQSIPQNFLVDPSGKIVAKDLRGEDLEKKLCELLGCM